jgi:hypothetical protein
MISPARINQGFPNFSFPSKLRQAFPDFRRMAKLSTSTVIDMPLTCVIDHTKIDSNLTHFPVPVKLTSDHDFLFDAVGENYLKLKIFKADQTTQLYCEVEQWDSVGQKALLWVSKSDWVISSTEDTKFYISYGDTYNTDFVGLAGSAAAQNVWNSDFAAVYNMAQDPSGGADCIIDSTANANHGTPSGSMTSDDLIDGIMGKAIVFDNDYIALPSNIAEGPVKATIESHFTVTDFDDYQCVFHKSSNPKLRTTQYWLGVETPSRKLTATIGAANTAWDAGKTDVSAVSDTPYHLKAVWDGAAVQTYVDNVPNIQYSLTSLTPMTAPSTLGAALSGSQYSFYGILENFRISVVDRSPAWIKADYYAQTNDLLTISESTG